MSMFIKTVTKRNRYSPKTFKYQYLVESVRTHKGPRHRFLLNLGKLTLPKAQWPVLARRIKEIIGGQKTLLRTNPQIERLASQYAQELIRRSEAQYSPSDQRHYETVDVDSVANSRVRTVGAEHVSLSYFRRLELDRLLGECGFSQRAVQVATLLVIGRLVSPGSERRTHRWAQHISAVDELLGTDFGHLSLNTLYKVSQQMLAAKEVIEKHLRDKERDLFGLQESIILYDLTNTFLEGRAAANPKAKFGKSKERRSDCRLLTLGLVIDGHGFPKVSKVFGGNQSEPKTLLEMINTLREADPHKTGAKPTVVIDAGLATEENLQQLKPHYHYICVSRKKMEPPESDDFILITDEKQNRVQAQKVTRHGEVFLYCKSQRKGKKEKAMQSRLEQLFEDQLQHIAESIHKKGCTKKYQKICERIGRLKEKYARIARFYLISVQDKDGLADKITWRYVKNKSDQKFSGSYYLRTDRTDLSEKRIWDIYSMLTELEEAFRSLKSELHIRPIRHQKQTPSDAHIFIAVCAYHILHSIRTRLKQTGLGYRWETIREMLSTHTRSTTCLRTQAEKTIYIRKCSQPEAFHTMIYDALNLEHVPCRPTRVIIE